MITPTAAAEKNDKNHDNMLNAAEEHIDQILACGFTTGSALTIDGSEFSLLRDISKLHDKLLDRYRKAGWDVQKYDDQRSGLTYTFSAKKK